MKLRNYMEVLINEAIDAVLKNSDGCTCDRCREDIKAYALNNLPPKYIVANELYTKLAILQSQFTIDVITKLAEAAEIIKKRPNH